MNRGIRICEHCKKDYSWWGKLKQDYKYRTEPGEAELAGVREADVIKIDSNTLKVRAICVECGKEEIFKVII